MHIEVLRDATRSIRKFQWGAYVLIGNIRAGKKNFTDADMQELLQLFELDYYKVEKYLEQFKGLDDSETEKYLRKKLREIRGEVARPADVIPFNLLKSLKIKKENDE